NLFAAITSPGSGGSTATYLCNSATNPAVTNVASTGAGTAAGKITMRSTTTGSAGNFTLTSNVSHITAPTAPAAGSGADGAGPQANIIAYDNLYSSCT